jgi:hypothetical protein
MVPLNHLPSVHTILSIKTGFNSALRPQSLRGFTSINTQALLFSVSSGGLYDYGFHLFLLTELLNMFEAAIHRYATMRHWIHPSEQLVPSRTVGCQNKSWLVRRGNSDAVYVLNPCPIQELPLHVMK